ncbi:MAG: helix-turn-helix domain-containing protein [Hyphomonadaceae bacterium]
MTVKLASRGAAAAAYQVVKPEQLRAVVSPARGAIYSMVAAFGPLSVREIADLIGAAPSSLYYHVERLLAVGLLTEAGARQIAKKPEQLYDVPSRRMRMTEALKDPRNARDINAIVGSICKQASRDFARGRSASHCRVSGAGRNLRFARLIGRPDQATLAKMNEHLEAIGDLLAESAGGNGEVVTLSWVLAPTTSRKKKSPRN